MARQGLRNNTKFLRLVQILKMPAPHVYGHLEFLWSVAYENGEPIIGDEMSIELSAGWNGEAGALCAALLACGGKGRAGFIEVTHRGNAGNSEVTDEKDCVTYQIHDLFDHAPGYVKDRATKEGNRRSGRECEWCGNAYRSSEPHSRFCCNSCRQQEFKSKKRSRSNAESNAYGNGVVTRVTQGNEPPSPAPAPLLNSYIPRTEIESGTPDDRESARRAFDQWSMKSRGHGISEANGDARKIHDLMATLAQGPPVVRGSASTPAHLLVAMAADQHRDEGKEFKAIGYAITCVANRVKEWIRSGIPVTGSNGDTEKKQPRPYVGAVRVDN